jgi:hypothetical protein
MSDFPSAGLRSVAEPESDGLLAGEALVRQASVTIVSGQAVVRGHVLGRIAASGKWAVSLLASSDGSQTPLAIAVRDVDASGGDLPGDIYVSGDFNAASLTFGTGHTEATVRAAMIGTPIFIR